MISTALLTAILEQYALQPGGIHGVGHWARVLENGRRLAVRTGADLDVLELFSVFHDACRVNDGWDYGHGRRGADLALRLRGRGFDLPDAKFRLLVEACQRHTGGQPPADITLLTCWDADRLDLLRVGITPDPRHLCPGAARAEDLRAWANQRAAGGFLPDLLRLEWGLDGSAGLPQER